MTTRAAVDDFLAQRKLAVVGVFRSGKGFGNAACKELKTKGYRLFAINPRAESIGSERCYPSLSALPEPVDGVLVVVSPAETEQVVRDAAAAGIRRVWLQQGARSEAAVRFCQDNGISVVHGECILMLAQPTALYHRMHRLVWRLLGKLPR
ncbi:MAG: CoA-binding protein [Chloroflexi bacterium]|nr:CoA-binding protein [Chloroflexota bacterium]